MKKIFVSLLWLVVLPVPAFAQSIFNSGTPGVLSNPTNSQGRMTGSPQGQPLIPPQAQVAGNSSNAAVSIGMQGSAVPGGARSALIDPKVMSKYDQQPGESNEDYMRRIKGMADRSVLDLEMLTQQNIAKLKAMGPK